MIRRFRVPFLAGLIAVMVGALGVANAQAAELHCSVEPCKVTLKPDGTGKTAHQVFIVKKGTASGAFTCESLTGEGVSATKTASSTGFESFVYSGCSIAGTAVSIHTTIKSGCTRTSIFWGLFKKEQCETEITVGSPTSCTVSLPAQSLSGLTFKDAGTTKTELTLSTLSKGIKGTAGAGCKAIVGFEGEFTEGEYTTGNLILTGETTAGVMASIWFE